jgi:hypothetical protein
MQLSPPPPRDERLTLGSFHFAHLDERRLVLLIEADDG